MRCSLMSKPNSLYTYAMCIGNRYILYIYIIIQQTRLLRFIERLKQLRGTECYAYTRSKK